MSAAARTATRAVLISLAAALVALAGAGCTHPATTSRGVAAPAATTGTATGTGTGPGTAPAPAPAPATVCSARAIQDRLDLANVTVASAASITSGRTAPGSPSVSGLRPFCAVTLKQADSAGNVISTVAWLPAPWNGRFQGVGGSYYSCGINESALAGGIQDGYATASTDCGIPAGHERTGQWGLRPDNTLNRPLINDFAYAGIHDMSVTGKAVTTAYYSQDPAYSYFQGCSTGGREGLMEAQRYPGDYNGIVSGAPAINWPQFLPSALWPQLVMKESNDYLPACKQAAFTEAVVKACSNQSGAVSPFITDPDNCHWSPARLVGVLTPCGMITQTDALVMERIWAGPTATDGKRLWYGVEPGASLSAQAGTSTIDGVTTPEPFSIPLGWFQYYLKQDPSWNWQTLTYSQFDQLFAQSVSEFSPVIATNNPDLSRFRKDGGKILIWHGLADQQISPQGTISYYQRVQQAMGGPEQTATFARLFLAPGAAHCESAAGPIPDNPLAAVVDWVEHGKPPTTIVGTLTNPVSNAITLTRPLCPYPASAAYTGHGSPSDASSFTCTTSKH